MAQNVNSYTINDINIIIKGMTCLFYIVYCVLISCKHSKYSHYDCLTLKLNNVELFILLYSVCISCKHSKSGHCDCITLKLNDMVRIRWYYLPDETKQGMRSFHGIKDVLLSNHYDVRSIHTIQGKCVGYSLENYMNLKLVGVDDYFCQSDYNYVEKCIVDAFVDVANDCEMPYNPDLLMVQCDGCKRMYILSKYHQ
ncbi:putative BAH domain-containing protein [Helianthus anomalus]